MNNHLISPTLYPPLLTPLIFILLLSTSCLNKPKTNYSSSSSSNFFSLSQTKLPLQMGICKEPLDITSQRLNKEETIHLLDSMLSTEGLTFKKDVTLSFDDINITVDSYNEQYKIGYIWIDSKNRGQGMSSNDIPAPLHLNTAKKHLTKDIDYHYQSYLKDSAYFFNHHFENDQAASLSLKKNLQESLPKYTNPTAQKVFFYAKYEAYYFAEHFHIYKKHPVSTALSVWLTSLKNNLKNKTTALALLRGISFPVEKYSKYNPIKQVLNAEIQAINNEKTNQAWQKRSEALLELLGFNSQHVFQTNPAYQKLPIEIITKYSWQKRKIHFHKLKRFIDINQISYKEAQQIDNANLKGMYFIALISNLDKRLNYTPQIYDDTKKEDLTWKIKLAKTQVQKDSLMAILHKIKTMSYTEKVAEIKALKIEKLTTDFKTYLHQTKHTP